MKIVFSILLVAAVIAGIVGLLGYDMYQKSLQEEAVRVAEAAATQQAFEDTLNTMLTDVQAGMEAYKIRRKALAALIRPVNLKEPGYVEENYHVAQDLIPRLQEEKDQIMAFFEKADGEIQRLIGEDEKGLITQSWHDLKQQHIAPYRAYFAAEGEILDAHRDLLAFYFANKYRFTYDPVSDSLVFEDENLAARQEKLRARIRDLLADQAKLLGKN